MDLEDHLGQFRDDVLASKRRWRGIAVGGLSGCYTEVEALKAACRLATAKADRSAIAAFFEDQQENEGDADAGEKEPELMAGGPAAPASQPLVEPAVVLSAPEPAAVREAAPLTDATLSANATQKRPAEVAGGAAAKKPRTSLSKPKGPPGPGPRSFSARP